jgi:hypothetical protein
VVYFFEKVKKEFVKRIHEEPTVGHLRIDKTREAVAVRYYFLSIFKVAKRVVKEYDICNKSRTATHKLYELLMSLLTLKELYTLIAIDFIVKLLLLREPLTGIVYNLI